MSAKKAAKKTVAKKTAAKKVAAKKAVVKNTAPMRAAARKLAQKAAKKAAGARVKEADNIIQMPGKVARAADALGALAKEHLAPLVKQHGKKMVAKAFLQLAKSSKNPLAKKGLEFLGDILS